MGMVWAGPLGFLVWLSWTCADDWTHDPNYGHGWFILPLFLFFLWRRWSMIPGESGERVHLSTLWLLPLPLLIAMVELVRLTPIFWRPLAWVIYGMGCVFTLFLAYRQMGGRGLRWLGFPLLFLAVAIPWPTAIEVTIVREFSFVIATIVGEILLLLGIFNEVNGRVIDLAQGSIGVDEACSGLRSLQSSLMISLAVGEWFWLTWGRRGVLLLAAVLGAMLLNVFRALALSLLVAYGGSAALDRWHDPVGMTALLLLTGAIVGLGFFFRREPPEADPGREGDRDGSHVVDFQLSRGMKGISVACIAAFLAAQGWYHWNSLEAAQDQPFVQMQHSELKVETEPPPDNINAILRADEGGYLILNPENQPQYIGYHFFWAPSRTNGKALFHRPDVCMPGAGWIQQEDATLYYGRLGEREVVVHRFIFRRGQQSGALLWMCWADDDPLAFSGKPYANLQSSFIPDFISMGKRVFAVEILAFFAPVQLTDGDEIGQLVTRWTGMEFVPD